VREALSAAAKVGRRFWLPGKAAQKDLTRSPGVYADYQS
jgi:hypothetical protein